MAHDCVLCVPGPPSAVSPLPSSLSRVARCHRQPFSKRRAVRATVRARVEVEVEGEVGAVVRAVRREVRV